MTYSWLDWSWDRDDSVGGCRAINPRVTTRFRILLPRLVSTGHSPGIRARWQRFRHAIEQHEVRHVRIVLDYARRIERVLAASSCDEAEAAVQRLRLAMNVDQDAFDSAQCEAFEAGRRDTAAIDQCVFPWLDAGFSDPSVAVHRPSA